MLLEHKRLDQTSAIGSLAARQFLLYRRLGKSGKNRVKSGLVATITDIAETKIVAHITI